MHRRIQSERGSAMVEAAIIFPCLVLIMMWSAAMTDIMVLKLKAAEAVRYALWESTVFKPPAQINTEVNQKFVDLRSPRDVTISYTGLLMYPLASDMMWAASVDTTSKKVPIGGNAKIPGGTGIEKYIGIVMSGLSRAVDSEMRRERFNVNGLAMARATLVHARHDEQASPILKGGDLLGLKGGNDLDHNKSMTNFSFQAPLPSQRPMELVFDTWKAWPKPAAYTKDTGKDKDRTNTAVSPMRTYPEVEDRVSAQVNDIVFFGLNRQPWFNGVRKVGNFIARILGPMAGGSLPDVFSADRMDKGTVRGPITILPPEAADVGWAPSQCEYKGSMQPCPNQRAGDLRISGSGYSTIDDSISLGRSVDRTRYTLPYRINTQYWTQSGGTNSGDATGKSAQLLKPKATLTTSNAYVETYRCRGHYFAGSQRGQEALVSKRYGGARCYR
jgi:hypothetical protein